MMKFWKFLILLRRKKRQTLQARSQDHLLVDNLEEDHQEECQAENSIDTPVNIEILEISDTSEDEIVEIPVTSADEDEDEAFKMARQIVFVLAFMCYARAASGLYRRLQHSSTFCRGDQSLEADVFVLFPRAFC
ncbi:hypothetical protein Pint_22407 [Pistacia integerrima]|uniref:Uncharacterized protein n=1 Tax=Pistacia integerrima TaxID=434235 RepID=A0ACC0YM93_9ROSI|nr:hypothetical protein Pint_22407 [Pistacia integerrima]